MTSITRGLTAGALALLAIPAWGQVTPKAYWQEMQELYSRMGYTLHVGSEEMDGDVLVLNDFSYIAEIEQQVGEEKISTKVEAHLDRMQIAPVDNAEYDLEVTASETMTSDLTMSPGGDAEDVTMSFTIDIPGNSMLIGKDGDRTLVEGGMDAMKFELSDFPVPEEDKLDGRMAVEIAKIAYKGNYGAGKDAAYDFEGSAASMSIGFHMEEGSNVATMAVNYQDAAFDIVGPLVNFTDYASMLVAGVTKLNMTAASSSMHFEVKEHDEEMLVTSTSGPGTLRMELGEGQIDYAFSGQDAVYNVSGNAMPLPPVTAELKRAGMRFAMPMVPMEEPGALIVELRLEGMTVSDEVWGMVDPGGSLPRDPVDLIVSVESSAKALVDLTNPDAMAQAAMMGPPFEFHDLKVKEVALRIAGAEITASGEAVINNDGFMPMPIGGLDVNIDGVLGVVEKLSALGVIPSSEAQAAPMMLGMFAKPGEGEDSFTTRVEMTKDGQITANGVPLQ